MRAAFEHLYTRLSTDAGVIALLPVKYRGSNEPVFNFIPEDAPSTLIFIGDTVTNEDRGAKNGDSLSALARHDVFAHVSRSAGSVSGVVILAQAIRDSLNRWSSATLFQGLNVERSTATDGPRVDNDTHYIAVVSWTGLLREP
jgi:hypothetical protein